MFRRRVSNKTSRVARPLSDAARLNGSVEGAKDDSRATMTVAGALLDYSLMLFLVFGGCCSNVWAYEGLLRAEPSLGPALTFSQMLFITAQQLPSFVTWDASSSSSSSSRSRSWSWLPRLKPRQVPIAQWLLQVTTFASGSLLNNLVYAYSVPLTVQIVFRSAGLAVSMLLGCIFLGKRYTLQQILAVAVVSSGVFIATLSRPRSAPPQTTTGTPSTTSHASPTAAVDASSAYTLGIAMLVVSLLCTGVHGALQERTYSTYGPCWRESVFYTHMLSLPMFVFMPRSLQRGFVGLSRPTKSHGLPGVTVVTSSTVTMGMGMSIHPYTMLALNLISQLICVSGVNKLSSRASAVSTQVVLTARKAISLCFSVWWFGGGWNVQLAGGAVMVFVGSFWYSFLPAPVRPTAQGKREKRS